MIDRSAIQQGAVRPVQASSGCVHGENMADESWQGVPDTHREAAEEIRAHLVCLRGGAPFLSPSDALQLVTWFDQGVTVGAILGALERAHAARRARRSRVPFGLAQARRHLGKPLSARPLPLLPVTDTGPLGPLAALIRSRTAQDPEADALDGLAAALASIGAGPADDLVRAAMMHIRAFRAGLWDRRTAAAREAARGDARRLLGDLLSDVDEGTAAALVEEEAREVVWSPYAWLDAATVWDIVEAS